MAGQVLEDWRKRKAHILCCPITSHFGCAIQCHRINRSILPTNTTKNHQLAYHRISHWCPHWANKFFHYYALQDNVIITSSEAAICPALILLLPIWEKLTGAAGLLLLEIALPTQKLKRPLSKRNSVERAKWSPKTQEASFFTSLLIKRQSLPICLGQISSFWHTTLSSRCNAAHLLCHPRNLRDLWVPLRTWALAESQILDPACYGLPANDQSSTVDLRALPPFPH